MVNFQSRLRRRRKGYRQRGRAFKRTRFATQRGKRRRSARLASMRRGRGSAKSRAVSFYKSKRVQAARTRVGLPKIEIKRTSDIVAEPNMQWAAYAQAANFNFMGVVDTVAQGTSHATRESRMVKWLPMTARLELEQLAGQERMYRIMVIRVFDNYDFTAPLQPAWFLKDPGNAGTALRTTYLRRSERGDEDPIEKWHIMYDKTIYLNTITPKSTHRLILIPIRGHTVDYDHDDASGATGAGKIAVVVVTDGTAASVDYTFDFTVQGSFLDQ